MAKDKYTNDIPTERGWYWVSRENLSFWEVCLVIDDRLKNTGWWVTLCGHKRNTYKLEVFHNQLSDTTEALWYGPIDEPERI